jgi:beta-galactosidase GanA
MFAVLASFVLSDRSFGIKGNDFYMDGSPFRYVSGSFHYFRQDPSLWEDTVKKMANGGLNCIQTYVAWNLHEPTKGKYIWDGLADIEKFVQICQKYNMYIILRPGPYICAEWDLGGFPYWLMRENIEFFRTADAVFLAHVDDWFKTLYTKLSPYMYLNGGNIIMVQIENEYGAYFACDKVYLKHLVDLAHNYLGANTFLFTVDNPFDFMEQCGALPEEAYATVDFGTDGDALANFAQQRRWNGGSGPYVNTEYYTGWMDHWGDTHATVSAAEVTSKLDYMLSLNASVNMYMYYGGTDFDYWSGANGDTVIYYLPDPTSYDYDAPLNEAGDLTWKYWRVLDVIKKYRPDIPVYTVANSTKKGYGQVTFTQAAALLDVIDIVSTNTSHTDDPLSFEAMNSPFGFALYQSVADDSGLFMTGQIHDRGVVIKNGEIEATFVRPKMVSSTVMKGDQITILVEDLGRVNFGYDFNLDQKGLYGKMTIGANELKGWTVKTIPLPSLDSTTIPFTASLPVHRPAFYLATFNVDVVADTFLNPTGLLRGVAFINGVNVGRYWTVGPQLTLYIRSKYLRVGQNELVVFETGDIGEVPTITFDDHATIDIKPSPLEIRQHRRPASGRH